MPGIITLLSDFGSSSPYPAQMKAVLARLCDATLLDISHDVRRHDVRMGAYLLAAVVPHTPAGTVHLAVVDPGVGTARRPLIVVAGGQFFVGPDNGLLLPAARRIGQHSVYEISDPAIVDAPVSGTFHGRDVFAPAAARLANGALPESLGRTIGGFVDLDFGTGRREGERLLGSVIYIDPFGNLITNISADLLEDLGKSVSVTVGRRRASGMTAATYGDVASGALAVVRGSDGSVEIAVSEGSAADLLAASPGAEVRIEPRRTSAPRPRHSPRRARRMGR